MTRSPKRPKPDATDASRLSTEELSQIESLLRVGASALSQRKPLEESHQIGATALHLIQRLKESQTQKPEAAET